VPSVSYRHVLKQGAVLGALGRTAFVALRQGMDGREQGSAPVVPGPELKRRSAPLPRKLIDDYVRYLGGDPRAYRGELPPHLFPQWCMPVVARTLEGLPYPLLRVVNGGCKVWINQALPDSEPIETMAQLTAIDDDGRRAVLHQIVRTGTSSVPNALRIEFQAVVPHVRKDGANGAGNHKPKREHARVPEDAREIARFDFAADTGLSFAKLTGDFNPIHWLPAYARASGFPSAILHGFGSFAFAWEALNRGLLGGDVHALTEVEMKLTRPLVLPHDVGLYVRGREMFIGDAPGGPAYLTGAFRLRGEP